MQTPTPALERSFTEFTSLLAHLPNAHVDTDQIIPARFLTTTQRAGLGKFCFNDWRYAADGSERADFVLHQPAFRGAGILLAGHNFGCGSSREHAPWALLDFGIRVVIATEIADIFRSNALKNGLLAIVVDAAAEAQLKQHVGQSLSIDLQACEIRGLASGAIAFTLDQFARECMLRGVDQLGYLLGESALIDAFEAQRAA